MAMSSRVRFRVQIQMVSKSGPCPVQRRVPAQDLAPNHPAVPTSYRFPVAGIDQAEIAPMADRIGRVVNQVHSVRLKRRSSCPRSSGPIRIMTVVRCRA